MQLSARSCAEFRVEAFVGRLAAERAEDLAAPDRKCTGAVAGLCRLLVANLADPERRSGGRAFPARAEPLACECSNRLAGRYSPMGSRFRASNSLDGERLIELLSVEPPRSVEAIEIPLWAARAWLRGDKRPLSESL